MTSRTPMLALGIAITLSSSGAVFAQAQTQPMPQQIQQQPTQEAQSMQPQTAPQAQPQTMAPQGDAGVTTSANAKSATFNTSQGQVTINSTMGQPPSTTSPPSFEQLSGGKKFITKEQANAYPPLANDFQYVAGANGSRISKAQYQRWLKNLN